jgi:hypothetical protein
LLILDSNLLKGLLLFLSEQLPTVSDGSHNLVQSQEREALTDNVSELLREVNVGRKRFFGL